MRSRKGSLRFSSSRLTVISIRVKITKQESGSVIGERETLVAFLLAIAIV